MTLKLPPGLAFALRNVFRQRVRSAATLAAISLGVAGLILASGFVQDIFIQLGEAIIHSQSGHLQVARQGYREGRTRAPESYLIERPDELKAKLAAEPGVQMVLARLGFSGVLNNGRRDLGIVGEGVEPAAEAVLGTLLDALAARRLLSDERYAEMRVNARSARYGNARLVHELRTQGVADELVAEALATGDDELTRARAVWLRKFGTPPADAGERAKQMRFLMSRGFAGETIRRVLRGDFEDD